MTPISCKTSTLLRCAVALGAAAAVHSAQAADFFAGKTINIVVSSDAGGGYDSYSRLLARYLGKYIPGSPSIVVQDEPGAGGLRAAQDIYSVAAKDGTEIGNLRASNMLDSILKIRGNQIDPTKLQWIGNMTSDTDLCTFYKTSGIHSFQDLKTKQTLVGASGAGSQGFIFPRLIDNVLGTKMKVIPGYKGTGDRILALQQGELQGNCGMNASTVTSHYPKMLADKELIPIMQSGLRPYPALPNVPLTQSFATTPMQKKILNTVFTQMDIARTFALPPGTPSDRVKILRTAFSKAMADPALLADAKRERLDINPSSGAQVAKAIADMADINDALRKQVRQALGE